MYVICSFVCALGTAVGTAHKHLEPGTDGSSYIAFPLIKAGPFQNQNSLACLVSTASLLHVPSSEAGVTDAPPCLPSISVGSGYPNSVSPSYFEF